jgi:hypothetical protein
MIRAGENEAEEDLVMEETPPPAYETPEQYTPEGMETSADPDQTEGIPPPSSYWGGALAEMEVHERSDQTETYLALPAAASGPVVLVGGIG